MNRVGKDGKGHSYSGDSSVIDPLGKILFQKSREAAIHTMDLPYSVLTDYRKSFPAWMDADGEALRFQPEEAPGNEI